MPIVSSLPRSHAPIDDRLTDDCCVQIAPEMHAEESGAIKAAWSVRNCAAPSASTKPLEPALLEFKVAAQAASRFFDDEAISQGLVKAPERRARVDQLSKRSLSTSVAGPQQRMAFIAFGFLVNHRLFFHY